MYNHKQMLDLITTAGVEHYKSKQVIEKVTKKGYECKVKTLINTNLPFTIKLGREEKAKNYKMLCVNL